MMKLFVLCCSFFVALCFFAEISFCNTIGPNINGIQLGMSLDDCKKTIKKLTKGKYIDKSLRISDKYIIKEKELLQSNTKCIDVYTENLNIQYLTCLYDTTTNTVTEFEISAAALGFRPIFFDPFHETAKKLFKSYNIPIEKVKAPANNAAPFIYETEDIEICIFKYYISVRKKTKK